MTANAAYMDSPGGARVVEVRGNVGRTARLYPACWWALWLRPWWSCVHSGAIRSAVSRWTCGVIGFPECRSAPCSITSSSSQPVVRC